MPFGDGTGPIWARDRNWRCFRRAGFGRGFGRGFGWRSFQGFNIVDSVDVSKDEKIKILTEELAELEKEKQELEKKLKELQ